MKYIYFLYFESQYGILDAPRSISHIKRNNITRKIGLTSDSWSVPTKVLDLRTREAFLPETSNNGTITPMDNVRPRSSNRLLFFLLHRDKRHHCAFVAKVRGRTELRRSNPRLWPDFVFPAKTAWCRWSPWAWRRPRRWTSASRSPISSWSITAKKRRLTKTPYPTSWTWDRYAYRNMGYLERMVWLIQLSKFRPYEHLWGMLVVLPYYSVITISYISSKEDSSLQIEVWVFILNGSTLWQVRFSLLQYHIIE